jgi:hypothetical protein
MILDPLRRAVSKAEERLQEDLEARPGEWWPGLDVEGKKKQLKEALAVLAFAERRELEAAKKK